MINITFKNQISLEYSGKKCNEVRHTCIAGWGSDALPCTLVGDCHLYYHEDWFEKNINQKKERLLWK